MGAVGRIAPIVIYCNWLVIDGPEHAPNVRAGHRALSVTGLALLRSRESPERAFQRRRAKRRPEGGSLADGLTGRGACFWL